MMFEHTKKETFLWDTGLYALSEGLRMQASGASDPWTVEREKEVVLYLRKRLHNWRRSGKPFDKAVKVLVREALGEWREMVERKRNFGKYPDYSYWMTGAFLWVAQSLPRGSKLFADSYEDLEAQVAAQYAKTCKHEWRWPWPDEVEDSNYIQAVCGLCNRQAVLKEAALKEMSYGHTEGV